MLLLRNPWRTCKECQERARIFKSYERKWVSGNYDYRKTAFPCNTKKGKWTAKEEFEIIKLEVKGESYKVNDSKSIFKEIQRSNDTQTYFDCTKLFNRGNAVTSHN